MAKPMPTEPPDCEKIMVLMPTSLPVMSTSAPPELPGLMAASVWMNTCVSDCAISVRASAEMMPLVTVWPTPNGLPMASTRSPTSSLSLSANSRNGKSLPPFSILSTARSVRSSWATILASNSRLSDSATRISVSAPPLTTCVLVTMTPSRADDHAGAERALDALLRQAEAAVPAEEALEERIVGERRDGRLHARADVDVDDGGRRLLDDGRIGVLQRLARRRNRAVLRRRGAGEPQPAPARRRSCG